MLIMLLHPRLLRPRKMAAAFPRGPLRRAPPARRRRTAAAAQAASPRESDQEDNATILLTQNVVVQV